MNMAIWPFPGWCQPQWWWSRRQLAYRCYRNLSYKQEITHLNSCTTTMEDLLPRLMTSGQDNKHCLDLYLPGPSSNRPRQPVQVPLSPSPPTVSMPLVVFVHGGGWRRGDRQGWRHYISDCDTNMLVALLFWIFGLYGSVGETLATSGMACAVVSYPLSRLPFPRCLIEHILSFGMSLVPTWPLLWLCTAFAIFSSSTSPGFPAFPNGNQLLYTGAITLLLAVIIRWAVVLWRLLEQTPSFTKGQVLLLGVPIGALLFSWVVILCLQGGPYMLSYRWVGFVTFCVMLVEAVFVLLYLRAAPIQHPDHVRAIALAVAWLLGLGRAAQEVPWEPGGLYLMGHSAGGHLVSLLTLDQRFLQEVGLSGAVIKGVVSISGIYDLSWMSSPLLIQYYLRPAFGSSSATWSQASPLQLLRVATKTSRSNGIQRNHALPPFLVCCAGAELPGLAAQAQDFCRELHARSACASYHVIANTNHFFIMASLKPQSQLDRLCVDFVNGVNIKTEYCL